MAEQRIQKVLSDQGYCSRRAAEQLIEEGRVKVNGHPVRLGDKMDPDYDKVSVDGKKSAHCAQASIYLSDAPQTPRLHHHRLGRAGPQDGHGPC